MSVTNLPEGFRFTPYADCNAAGGMAAYNWEADPKRIAFQAARYLTVAKLLEGKRRVLEVGCADGWGARIVRQHVANLDAIDIDESAIAIAEKNYSLRWPVFFLCADVLKTTFIGYDACYCLDLFEHLRDEAGLLARLAAIAPICVIGTPSVEAQIYASEISQREHVNCVSKSGLRDRMAKHWRHVFVLGMNDTTLHTGHDAMTHYLFGIGCN